MSSKQKQEKCPNGDSGRRPKVSVLRVVGEGEALQKISNDFINVADELGLV